MSGLEIFFLITAIATLGAALMVVTTPNLTHAIWWLIAALFGVAVVFVLLNAPFLAVVQVVVYIGAISILMVFAIMLTRHVMQDDDRQTNANWSVAALLGILLFVGLGILFVNSATANQAAPALSPKVDLVSSLGQALVSPNAYVLPFELASVLLLAALVGAIVVAKKK